MAQVEQPREAAFGKSGVLRAAIFGVNDGIVSNLALVVGVAGAGVPRSMIVVAGVAGLLAGAFSMGAGEYVSVKVQREVLESLLRREKRELAEDPAGEQLELAGLFEDIGLESAMASAAATAVMVEPERALDVHARLELGLDQDALGSPLRAALWSFASFVVGAMLPLLPYLVVPSIAAASAVVLSLASLFAVGASMSLFTSRPWVRSGARMVLIGGSAAFVTFAVGRLIGVNV